MGYESKLFIVDKSKYSSSNIENGRHWCEIIAMFDLCKVYSVSDKMRKYPETDGYFYAYDSNTVITEDLYGDIMREIPIKDAIKIIEDAEKAEPNYRRFKPCISLLKSFNENEWENLVVLHYGH